MELDAVKNTARSLNSRKKIIYIRILLFMFTWRVAVNIPSGVALGITTGEAA